MKKTQNPEFHQLKKWITFSNTNKTDNQQVKHSRILILYAILISESQPGGIQFFRLALVTNHIFHAHLKEIYVSFYCFGILFLQCGHDLRYFLAEVTIYVSSLHLLFFLND